MTGRTSPIGAARALVCAALLSACTPTAGPAAAPLDAAPRPLDGPATTAPPPPEMPAPPPAPLPPIPTLAPGRQQLASGARVVILERHEAPLVALRLVVLAGSASDGEHAGAALVTAHAIAAHGIDRAAKLGGDLAVSVGPDAATFAIDVEPRAAAGAIELLSELARGSTLPGRAEVSRLARGLAERAHRAAAREDEDGARFVIERDAFDLPTARHPYATTVPTADELEHVPPEAVRTLAAARYRPAGATLVVVGDVRAVEAISAAERALGRRASPAPAPIDLPEPFPRPADRATVLERGPGDRARSFVGLASPGGADAATAAALEVTSRIVRGRLGEGARDSTRRVRSGPTIVRWDAPVAPDRAGELLPKLRATLADLAESMPPPDEVERAQRELLGEALRRLAAPHETADLLAAEVASGGDDAAVVPRLRAIAEVTPPLVSLVARDLARAPAHVVASGDASRVAPALAALAEVKVVDPSSGFARLRTLPRSGP